MTALQYVVFVALLSVGCVSCGDAPANSAMPPTTVAPPTGTPTTAPPTPAPAPGVRFESAFPSLPKLERPVAMVEIPGQRRMLVALQDGRLVSFAKDAAAADLSLVLDQRAKTSRDDNEEGLLGLALDPGFDRNGFVYVYYSAEGGPRRTILSRLATSGTGAGFRADPASELVILTVPQPFGNHKGGQFAFGPDGMLYLGLGDGGSGGDPQGNGQSLARNLLAKIIRLDVRNATKENPYAIPLDNPFAGGGGETKRETWAYGLRNPWRFSFDRATGQLWAGDVGQDEREEIDLVEKGKNYGWNVTEGTACYRPKSGCNRDGLTLPVIDYTHDNGNCSVTGGYVYRGKAIPALTGWYVYGDYCTGAVWAFNTEEVVPGRAPRVVQLRPKGPELASFAEDLDGELYLLAFDGSIYRISP